MAEQTCFLIDDDEDDREIFQIALKEVSPHVNCVTSKNGIEALKILSEEDFTPDYIFIDINMPLMTGEECLTFIRQFNRLKNVPIYMYTTSAGMDHKENILAKGANELIIKPARFSDMVQILKDRIK